MDTDPEKYIQIDDSKISGLQKILPPAIYARKLEDFVKQNKEQGVTNSDLEEIEEYLRDIGKEYSGKTRQNIYKIADEIAASLPPPKELSEKVAHVVSIILNEFVLLCKNGIPFLRDAIVTVITFIMDTITDIFSALISSA